MVDIRKVQKTGNMHYVYLPTSWCKQNKITSNSNVSLDEGPSNELIIYPQIITKQGKDLKLDIRTNKIDVIEKILMACYINPMKSFRLDFDKNIDLSKLLTQKRLFNVDFIEIEKNAIFCESNIAINNPSSLLNTLVRKIKALLFLMINNYDVLAMEKYEEEVDKAKILIDKAMITALSDARLEKTRSIDLFYMTMIARSLETMVDSLIIIKSTEKEFLKSVLDLIEALHVILETLPVDNELSCRNAIGFIEKALNLEEPKLATQACYTKRIKKSIIRVSEVLIDWSITKKLEQKN
ncbi:MAG: hypothetical protein AABW72_01080 [archaeon]